MTFPFERDAQGWSIRVPLRREEVRVEKRTVVAERVVVRRHAVADVERVDTKVRREKLRADSEALDVTQPIEPTTRIHHGTLSETGLDQDPLHG